MLLVKNLQKTFVTRQGFFSRQKEVLHAVRGVSFDLNKSETLGVVGESGCGKSTLARVIMRLYEPDSGQVILDGVDISRMSQKELRPYRKKFQMIFQDPFASLHPRMRVGDIIAEPLVIHGCVRRKEKRDRVSVLMEKVGLSPDYYDRYPHEFSGGQRQRVGIARAIALEPDVIIADEPLSALDVSVAAQIANLLKDLQEQQGLAFVFIAHDLNMVNYLSHRVAVMYLGKIVEMAPKEMMRTPKHPYTEALLKAIPSLESVHQGVRKKKELVSGEPPSPLHPPKGCSFCTRCPRVEERCRQEEPLLLEKTPGHWVACHLE